MTPTHEQITKFFAGLIRLYKNEPAVYAQVDVDAMLAIRDLALQSLQTPAPDAGMPPEPKRYDCATESLGDYRGDMAVMEEYVTGDYITYADYALLKSYIQRQGKGEL